MTRWNSVACQQKLTASDGSWGDNFGSSVSVDGDTAVVGANYDNDLGPDSGSAYVFVRSGTTWTEHQKLTASDGAALDFFGSGVSVAGDTALVGTSFSDDAAYVFVREGTIWSQRWKLTPSDGAADRAFGYAVSLDAATAFVGAPRDDDLEYQSGAVYAFDITLLTPRAGIRSRIFGRLALSRQK